MPEPSTEATPAVFDFGWPRKADEALGAFVPCDSNSDQHRNACHGYTLTELLVVLGIIVVLISILLPVLTKVRESTRQITCLSNMRQIAAAQQLYMNDNEGNFPPTRFDINYPGTSNFATDGVWNGTYPNILGCLKPYLSGNLKVYTCPEYYITRAPYLYTSNNTFDRSAITNYQPNAIFSSTQFTFEGSGISAGAPLAALRGSANIILDQEWLYFSNSCFPRPCLAYAGDLQTYTIWHSNSFNTGTNWTSFEQYSMIHSKGGNVAYADGHAEWRAASSLRASDFGLTGGSGVSGSASDTNAAYTFATYRRMRW